jgi:hypothetical protein
VRDARDDNTVFSALAAFNVGDFGLEGNGVIRPVWGYEVSGQYFEVVVIKRSSGGCCGAPMTTIPEPPPDLQD